MPASSKWKDHLVKDWEQIEEINEAMQTDTASCGLFLLKFMEYWTGKKLLIRFTQEDMQNFRLKLAVLLVDSKLNTIKRGTTNNMSQDQVEVNTDAQAKDQAEVNKSVQAEDEGCTKVE